MRSKYHRQHLRFASLAALILCLTACNIPKQQMRPPASTQISDAVSGVPQSPVTLVASTNSPIQQISYQQSPVNTDAAVVVRTEPIARIPLSAETGGPTSIVHPGAPYPANWSPPQISQPWPEDEYVYQGGDSRQRVNVAPDGLSIHNLDEEDTIVHYHTGDGKIAIQPTNLIPIYAPRFSSVRHIGGASQYLHRDHASGVDNPLKIAAAQENLGSEQVLQRLQAGRNISNRRTGLYRDESKARDVEYRLASLEGSQRQKPENGLLHNTRVRIQNSQEARLSMQNTAAITATDEETVKVYVKDFMPYKVTGQNQMQSTYHYEIAEGKSRLEIKKTSSSLTAIPGDELEFMIAFKNVGDQPVSNVTIVDHLSRRLVYIEDTQSCDVAGKFFANDTVKESLILRWEITDPLAVGESGSITFRCRVR
ncbi:MAG: DUF11 domain-containing protein [Planctomycetaceae bacterium]|jgi:uncharacterized repeat protein (TIGR01451 family)|nr:DUF11 domain-containing protein [Planctomycetaceae bacterium]